MSAANEASDKSNLVSEKNQAKSEPESVVRFVKDENAKVIIEDADSRPEDDAGDTTNLPEKRTYAAKKRLAQGMIDLALLASNACQLQNLVENHATTRLYPMLLTLILSSILLQIALGLGMIFYGYYSPKSKLRSEKIKEIDNVVLAGVFLITILNIFLASFSPSSTQPINPPAVVNSTN